MGFCNCQVRRSTSSIKYPAMEPDESFSPLRTEFDTTVIRSRVRRTKMVAQTPSGTVSAAFQAKSPVENQERWPVTPTTELPRTLTC
jgi:hypothetical protein